MNFINLFGLDAFKFQTFVSRSPFCACFMFFNNSLRLRSHTWKLVTVAWSFFFLLLNTIRQREQVKELFLSEIENDTLLKRNNQVVALHPLFTRSTSVQFHNDRFYVFTLLHIVSLFKWRWFIVSSLSPFNEINIYPLSWLTYEFLRKFHLKITSFTFSANHISMKFALLRCYSNDVSP